MTDILTQHAINQGDKLAIIHDMPHGALVTWTFLELEEKSNQLARALLSLSIEPGSRIVWCGMNSPWIMATVHAARKIDAVAVPLNYRLSAEEAAYVINNSDAEIVISDAEYSGLFEEIRGDIPGVREILIFDGLPGENMLSLTELAREMDMETLDFEPAGNTGTMIYTSGTTGKPKGAVRGAGDPDQQAALLAQIGYRTDDVYITTGPLYHSGPGGFATLSHIIGNTIVIQKKFDPVDWLRLVDKYRVTSTFSAPTPIRKICQLDADVWDEFDVSCMRIMIANAAPWSWALKMSYLQRFPTESLFEVYGSTELGVNTVLMPEDQVERKGSCGKPAPGVVITLYDENGNRVTEPHVPGELYVESASVFDTYHKAAEKYEQDRRGKSHTVGDIAYFDEDGFYYICDRKKDMIISGGMNIYPAEIEAALEQSPDVTDVAVIGIPSEEWGESVHAIVVSPPDRVPFEEDIINFARNHLAGYKIPRSVSFVDEIPRNGSGKILKKELKAPFWSEHENSLL